MTPAALCPRCSSKMYRLYEHPTDPLTGKRHYIPVAWRCSNPHCRHIMQD